MVKPIYFEDETNFQYDLERRTSRGCLVQIHIADIHFGAINPKVEYDILHEQFINRIKDFSVIDIISVDGDLFDRKYMSNTDVVLYATKFIADIVMICKAYNITLIMIDGTKEHDAGQLKLFYHYLSDPEIDIRIVENIQFEYVKGSKILCIPELYGIPEEVYDRYLHYSGVYDMCFMHGTFEGSVYGNNAGQSRLFTINDFSNCLGPIISGHVHTGGCFNSYFYYTGSTMRYKFGEEQTKGFLVVLYDMDTRRHYIHLEEIKSFRYDTVNLDALINADPKDIISYIDNLKKQGIEHLRLEFSQEISPESMNIIREYYKTNSEIKFKVSDSRKTTKDTIDNRDMELYNQYSYLFDSSMSEYDKLAKYIVDKENGSIYITGEDIKNILEEDV